MRDVIERHADRLAAISVDPDSAAHGVLPISALPGADEAALVAGGFMNPRGPAGTGG